MHGSCFRLSTDNFNTLRLIIRNVEGDIRRLTDSSRTDQDDESAVRLRASWSELVEMLDLGPVPDLRECPYCHNLGMRAATRCGYCWKSLIPSAESTSAGAPRSIVSSVTDSARDIPAAQTSSS